MSLKFPFCVSMQGHLDSHLFPYLPASLTTLAPPSVHPGPPPPYFTLLPFPSPNRPDYTLPQCVTPARFTLDSAPSHHHWPHSAFSFSFLLDHTPFCKTGPLFSSTSTLPPSKAGPADRRSEGSTGVALLTFSSGPFTAP